MCILLLRLSLLIGSLSEHQRIRCTHKYTYIHAALICSSLTKCIEKQDFLPILPVQPCMVHSSCPLSIFNFLLWHVLAPTISIFDYLFKLLVCKQSLLSLPLWTCLCHFHWVPTPLIRLSPTAVPPKCMPSSSHPFSDTLGQATFSADNLPPSGSENPRWAVLPVWMPPDLGQSLISHFMLFTFQGCSDWSSNTVESGPPRLIPSLFHPGFCPHALELKSLGREESRKKLQKSFISSLSSSMNTLQGFWL